MAITIDAANKRIILDSVSTTATEIYSRVTDWQALSDNIKYGMIIRQVGSDDLGDGLSIPPYYFLQGLWRVRPMESNHDLVITGNLFVEGGGTPVVRTLGSYQVNVKYTVPVQAQGISTSGTPAPTADEVAAAVWQHTTGAAVATRLAEAWARLGLDPAAPLVTGQTSITFGEIVMALTGDATSTTVTRQ